MTLRIDKAQNGVEKECPKLVIMEKKPIVSCKFINLEVHILANCYARLSLNRPTSDLKWR